jgi:hypothetical protein
MLVPGAPTPGYPGVGVGWPAFRRLREYWTVRQPDVIYVATPGPLGSASVRTANRLTIPVLSGLHTDFSAYLRYYGLAGLDAASASTCVGCTAAAARRSYRAWTSVSGCVPRASRTSRFSVGAWTVGHSAPGTAIFRCAALGAHTCPRVLRRPGRHGRLRQDGGASWAEATNARLAPPGCRSGSCVSSPDPYATTGCSSTSFALRALR